MSETNAIEQSLYLLFILHLRQRTIVLISGFIPPWPSPSHTTLGYLALIATAGISFSVSSNISSMINVSTFTTASITILRKSPPLSSIAQENLSQKMELESKEYLIKQLLKV